MVAQRPTEAPANTWWELHCRIARLVLDLDEEPEECMGLMHTLRNIYTTRNIDENEKLNILAEALNKTVIRDNIYRRGLHLTIAGKILDAIRKGRKATLYNIVEDLKLSDDGRNDQELANAIVKCNIRCREVTCRDTGLACRLALEIRLDNRYSSTYVIIICLEATRQGKHSTMCKRFILDGNVASLDLGYVDLISLINSRKLDLTISRIYFNFDKGELYLVRSAKKIIDNCNILFDTESNVKLDDRDDRLNELINKQFEEYEIYGDCNGKKGGINKYMEALTIDINKIKIINICGNKLYVICSF